MKVLLLGPLRPTIVDALLASGDEVLSTEAPLTVEELMAMQAAFLVSYGYRHILTPDVLARFPFRAVNLHISLLPWNRGADPNLWSFLEDTPKGVTIHHIAPGIDTGDILAQQEISLGPDVTLRTSYEHLSRSIEELFQRCWPKLRRNELPGIPQAPGGSYHRTADRRPYEPLMTAGWDTPVRHLVGAALSKGLIDA